MSISLASLQRVSANRPPIIGIHGGPGVGKTTFAVQAPDVVFIRTEDGLGNLTATAFPVAQSFNDVMAALTALHNETHAFRWVVIDSLSALEPMIWADLCKRDGKANIEDFGYGKGYILAMDYWQRLINELIALASDKGIGSILIAHTDIVRYESPEVDAYDRAQIKLHKRAFQLMYERCDVIGYAAPRVIVRKEKTGITATRNLGVGTGERLLHLVEKPAHIAKNRYSLPDTLPLSWPTFEAALMAAVTPQPTLSAAAAA